MHTALRALRYNRLDRYVRRDASQCPFTQGLTFPKPYPDRRNGLLQWATDTVLSVFARTVILYWKPATAGGAGLQYIG